MHGRYWVTAYSDLAFELKEQKSTLQIIYEKIIFPALIILLGWILVFIWPPVLIVCLLALLDKNGTRSFESECESAIMWQASSLLGQFYA